MTARGGLPSRRVAHLHDPAKVAYERDRGNPMIWGYRWRGRAWHSFCLLAALEAEGWTPSTREPYGAAEGWFCSAGHASRSRVYLDAQLAVGRLWLSMRDAGLSSDELPDRIADAPDAALAFCSACPHPGRCDCLARDQMYACRAMG